MSRETATEITTEPTENTEGDYIFIRRMPSTKPLSVFSVGSVVILFPKNAYFGILILVNGVLTEQRIVLAPCLETYKLER